MGVLGTGISALAAAHYVKKAGFDVTVLDVDSGSARPGKTFSYNGCRFDQFSQPIAESDTESLAFLRDLGIGAELQWHGTNFGRNFFWPKWRKHKVATCAGLSQSIEQALRTDLAVDHAARAIDLLEFDHCIELRTDRRRRAFDAIITTLSLDEVDDVARGLLAQEIPGNRYRPLTLANVVFITPTPLFKKYTTFVAANRQPFCWVSSTTDVESQLTAIHVCGYSEMPPLELKLLATRFLCQNYSEFQPSLVREVQVFQSPEGVPLNRPIPARVGETRLFLASRELGCVAPMSINTDLILAKGAVAELLECAPIFACGARQVAHAAGR